MCHYITSNPISELKLIANCRIKPLEGFNAIIDRFKDWKRLCGYGELPSEIRHSSQIRAKFERLSETCIGNKVKLHNFT